MENFQQELNRPKLDAAVEHFLKDNAVNQERKKGTEQKFHSP